MTRGLLAALGLLAFAPAIFADYIVLRINIGSGSTAQPGPGNPGGPGGEMPRPPGLQMGGGQVGGKPPGGAVTGRPPNTGGGMNIGFQMGGGTVTGRPPNTGGAIVGIPPNTGGANTGGGNTGVPPIGGKQEWFLVVIEGEVQQQGNEVVIKHKWGTTPLDPRSQIENKAYMHWQAAKPLADRTEAKFLETKGDPMQFAAWMLDNWNMPAKGFSMRKRFEENLDRMKNNQIFKPDTPEGKKLAAMLDARDKLNDIFDGKLKPDAKLTEQVMKIAKGVNADAKREWKVLESKGPYQIIYADADEKSAEQRMKRLDHFYAGFYYWFAMQGKSLKHPEKQMLGVLAKDVEQFKKLHDVFDDAPCSQDGFYSGFDNVVVFSPGRVDTQFTDFEAQSKSFEATLKADNLSYAALLKGEKLPEKVAKEIQQGNKEVMTKVVYGRIMGLALHGAQDEGEIATVTHEGLQQLAQVSGLFPRRVRLPESVRYGFGSVFETPKSKAIGSLWQPAIWPGMACPHWVYLPVAHYLAQNENKTIKIDGEHEINIGSVSILRVLRDTSFQEAAKADKKIRDVMLDKARAEAWSLTYFLAKAPKSGGRYLDDLLAFYEELDKLPRDQDVQQQTIERCFVRAFKLGLDDKPDTLDQKKLESLEADWKKFIASVKPTAIIDMKATGKTAPSP